jgi:hypothetical protein
MKNARGIVKNFFLLPHFFGHIIKNAKATVSFAMSLRLHEVTVALTGYIVIELFI